MIENYMHLAIYEFLAFIIALPLSYGLAYLAKKFTYDTYKDECNKLFLAFWDGSKEDELYAWLKVRQLFLNKKAPKKMAYINRKIKNLNKSGLYGGVEVNKKGELTGLLEFSHQEND